MSELRKDYYVPDKYVLIPNNFDQLNKFPEMIYNEQQTFHKSDSHECPYCPCSVDKCDNLVLSSGVGVFTKIPNPLSNPDHEVTSG